MVGVFSLMTFPTNPSGPEGELRRVLTALFRLKISPNAGPIVGSMVGTLWRRNTIPAAHRLVSEHSAGVVGVRQPGRLLLPAALKLTRSLCDSLPSRIGV